jgi:ABC-2 type transport system permease protein
VSALSLPVLRLTLRNLISGRRPIVLAVLALVPVAAALVYAGSDAEVDPRIFWARLVQRLLIPTVCAFIAIVVGASALGDEREDGTILYLVSTPLPRRALVVTAVAAAWALVMTLLAPTLLVAGVVALGDHVAAGSLLWPLAGTALAALCYCAVAAWLSLATRRPVVVGVLYILLWEGSIATFAASADRLSIAAYGRAIAVEGVPDVNAPDTSGGVAAIVLIAVTALAGWRATRRLGRTELP